VSEKTESAALVKTDNHISVMAMDPDQRQVAQKDLLTWFEGKAAAVGEEAKEIAENLAIAVKNKWRTRTLKRMLELVEKRVLYYQKIAEALKAGYHIIPNFPMDMIAIRTDRRAPLKKKSNYRWANFEQSPKLLPIGDGRYVSPFPFVESETYEVDEKNHQGEMKTVEKKEYSASDFDMVEFPMAMAKPQIMEATGEAMGKMLFDSIGLMPQTQANRDPIIAGEIRDPRGTSRNELRVTFLIAWYLNTADI
jgi:hypothetical protein